MADCVDWWANVEPMPFCSISACSLLKGTRDHVWQGTLFSAYIQQATCLFYKTPRADSNWKNILDKPLAYDQVVNTKIGF